jgi:hypothetical protein
MHFWPVVLIPAETPITEEDVWDAVWRLLEPYCVEREGAQRKEYFTAEEIRFIRGQFWLPPKSLPKLAEKLRRGWDMDCGVDEDGLYSMTTLNPDGKYDWFTVPGLEFVWPASHMPRDLQPSAVITLDGEWHDMEIEKWDWQLTDYERAAIRTRAYSIIDQYPAQLAVMVDCHV